MRVVLPLNRWLVLSYLVVLLLPAGAVLCSGALAKDLAHQTEEDLDHQAALLALHVVSELHHAGPDARLDAVAPRIATVLVAAKEETLAGFRVVNVDGIVVASSSGETGDDLADDPLVAKALAGSAGMEKRPRGETRAPVNAYRTKSRQADYRVFVAKPLVVDGRLDGALVLSRTPREEFQTLWQMAPRLSLGVLAALAATLGLGGLAGHILSRSLKNLVRASRQIAAGSTLHLPDLAGPAGSHVAETAELADAMAAMADRLQERVAYIAEFAGNVSHEFKTPVSALRGTVELLRDDEDMPAAQRARFLDNALADLDRLSRLVGGLLRLARAEEGGDRTRFCLSDAIAPLAGRFPALQVAGEFGWVEANREQVEAALGNLVENAWRHGGEGVTVRVLGKVEAGRAMVEVIDDGVGISSANLPRIFDRFFTTNRAGGGTGLGLALVRAIARTHGGDVTVRSDTGRTCFRWWLPASP